MFIQRREKSIHKIELVMSLLFENYAIRVDPGYKLGLKKKTGNINYCNGNAQRYIITFP